MSHCVINNNSFSRSCNLALFFFEKRQARVSHTSFGVVASRMCSDTSSSIVVFKANTALPTLIFYLCRPPFGCVFIAVDYFPQILALHVRHHACWPCTVILIVKLLNPSNNLKISCVCYCLCYCCLGWCVLLTCCLYCMLLQGNYCCCLCLCTCCGVDAARFTATATCLCSYCYFHVCQLLKSAVLICLLCCLLLLDHLLQATAMNEKAVVWNMICSSKTTVAGVTVCHVCHVCYKLLDNKHHCWIVSLLQEATAASGLFSKLKSCFCHCFERYAKDIAASRVPFLLPNLLALLFNL